MAFFDHVKRKFNNQDPQQLKQELLWLLDRMRQYKGKILTVGLLGVLGTAMGLASSVASKFLIDAVTGSSSDKLVQAAVAMALMMLSSLVLQGISSRISASVHMHVKNEMQHEL